MAKKSAALDDEAPWRKSNKGQAYHYEIVEETEDPDEDFAPSGRLFEPSQSVDPSYEKWLNPEPANNNRVQNELLDDRYPKNKPETIIKSRFAPVRFSLETKQREDKNKVVESKATKSSFVKEDDDDVVLIDDGRSVNSALKNDTNSVPTIKNIFSNPPPPTNTAPPFNQRVPVLSPQYTGHPYAVPNANNPSVGFGMWESTRYSIPPVNTQQLPPTHHPPPQIPNWPAQNDPFRDMRKSRFDQEAVKNEAREQNDNMKGQLDTYLKKYTFLTEELNKLKKQRRDLSDSGDLEVETVIKANQELQTDIQNKIKGVKNVIEMLSKLIKDDAQLEKINEKLNETNNSESRTRHRSKSRGRHRSKSRGRRSKSRGRRSPSPRRRSRSRSRSPKNHYARSRSREQRSERMKEKKESVPKISDKDDKSRGKVIEKLQKFAKESEVKQNIQCKEEEELSSKSTKLNEKQVEKEASGALNVNRVYFDPEKHWCQVCDIFPRTAKDFLIHLHDQKHKDEMTKRKMIDYPWHKFQPPESKKPNILDAPIERIPISGLQFFVSAPSWYCKLCNHWMGDLHCASAHLKSNEHEVKYKEFIDTNPFWEETWLQTRAKALELYSRAQTVSQEVFTCAAPPFSVDAGKQLVDESPRSTTPSQEDARLYLQRIRSGKSAADASVRNDSPGRDRSPDRKRRRGGRSRSRSRSRSPVGYRGRERHRSRERDTRYENDDRSDKYDRGDRSTDGKRMAQDKFVDEWMNPRITKRTKEIEDLRDKLKQKEEENRAHRIKLEEMQADKRREMDSRREESLKNTGKELGIKGQKKILTPITIGKPQPKLPIIGRMPSKKKEKEGTLTASTEKTFVASPSLKDISLPDTAKHEFAVPAVPSIGSGNKKKKNKSGANNREHVSNLNVCDEGTRKKDFEQTLKILFPSAKEKVEKNNSNKSNSVDSNGNLETLIQKEMMQKLQSGAFADGIPNQKRLLEMMNEMVASHLAATASQKNGKKSNDDEKVQKIIDTADDKKQQQKDEIEKRVREKRDEIKKQMKRVGLEKEENNAPLDMSSIALPEPKKHQNNFTVNDVSLAPLIDADNELMMLGIDENDSTASGFF